MTSYDDESIVGATGHASISLPILEEEETLSAPSEAPSGKVESSFRKRTSTVWNDFYRVLIDEVYKAKYKKYAKLYTCANIGETNNLKRHQESHRISDSRLQSTLNIQEGALVGTFAYNHENQRKALVK